MIPCKSCYGIGGHVIQNGKDDTALEICDDCDGTGIEVNHEFEKQSILEKLNGLY